jgi:hypothetical protein
MRRVRAPKFAFHGRCHRINLFCFRHIGGHPDRPHAEALGNPRGFLFEPLTLTGNQHEVDAFGGECFCHRQPDAHTATGDDGHFTF